MEKKDIKSMDLEELTQELLAMGEKKFRAGQIYGWMHVHLVRSIDEMTNISQKLREQLKENYAFTAGKMLERAGFPGGGTAQDRWYAEVSVPACGRQCGGICLDAV